MAQLTLVIGNKNYSSWSLRPWLAMKQARLDFNEIKIALDTPTSTQEIRQYSGAGKVPILLDNGLTIWDSLAICEYLAENYPVICWWPKDKTARAVARCISAEMHSGFLALRQNMPMNCRAFLPGQGISPPVQADIDRIVTIWQECRYNFGAGGKLLFGEFSIADAMFAPVVLRFVTYAVQLSTVAQAYRDAVLALPAMQEWLTAATIELEILPASEL